MKLVCGVLRINGLIRIAGNPCYYAHPHTHSFYVTTTGQMRKYSMKGTRTQCMYSWVYKHTLGRKAIYIITTSLIPANFLSQEVFILYTSLITLETFIYVTPDRNEWIYENVGKSLFFQVYVNF